MSSEVASKKSCPKCGYLVEEGNICSPCFLRARNARMRRDMKHPPLDFVRDTHPDPHADCLCEKITEYRVVAKKVWQQALMTAAAIHRLLPDEVREEFSQPVINIRAWKNRLAQYQDGDVVDMHVVTLIRDMIDATEAMIALRKIDPSKVRENN